MLKIFFFTIYTMSENPWLSDHFLFSCLFLFNSFYFLDNFLRTRLSFYSVVSSPGTAPMVLELVVSTSNHTHQDSVMTIVIVPRLASGDREGKKLYEDLSSPTIKKLSHKLCCGFIYMIIYIKISCFFDYYVLIFKLEILSPEIVK